MMMHRAEHLLRLEARCLVILKMPSGRPRWPKQQIWEPSISSIDSQLHHPLAPSRQLLACWLAAKRNDMARSIAEWRRHWKTILQELVSIWGISCGMTVMLALYIHWSCSHQQNDFVFLIGNMPHLCLKYLKPCRWPFVIRLWLMSCEIIFQHDAYDPPQLGQVWLLSK